ncbi:hypothetical protein K1719_035734 [Acacia pycnantha]|nr:hypothetical protein K1719_035734 [Acacia pycnantha]
MQSLDIPLHENSRATNDQHDTSTPYGVVDNNLTCTFHSNYLDDGDASLECQLCGSHMWFAKRPKGLKKNLVAQFDICCCKGKIIVPLLKMPPEELEQLFFNKDSSHAKKFLRNIRFYNNMFSFTSMGGRIDHSINSKGGGPYSFVLSGQNHHLIGSLLPPQGNPPVYAQLYIYDIENEVSNRISAVRNATEIIKHNVISDVSIRLIRSSNVTGQSKQYNMPTTSELAALIVGDFDNSYTKRDIIVKRQSESLQRIDELHMAYLPLQYPLLFPYGDNGYDSSNEHAQESLSTTKKKKKLTPREYMAFRLMRRKSERCSYQRRDGPFIDKTASYFTVFFHRGARYMIQNYQDAMAICAWAGYPDIFLTFTCNPMWPEITRHCEKDDLKPYDKPEILSRVFHMKLDKLMRILKDEKILGSIKAGETMSSLVNNPWVKESMFLAWFEKNKDDPFTRTLTYSQFPNHFTFVREKRFWKIRERDFSVGRIGHCTGQGELYYLRLLLTKVRGTKTYTDIRTVDTVVYPTFREACYALGLLDDDQEYIDAIKEASSWASSNYLRQFFTNMLLSHCLSQPAIVWEHTKGFLCEDLLHISHGDNRFPGI